MVGGMANEMERVVVVGASLAGLRAAETLRNPGGEIEPFAGEVVVIGAEPHRPYDRPPLSKKLLAGEWEPDRIHLRQPDSFDALDVEWRFGVAASSLDVRERRVMLSDGTSLDFDGFIIATGATCRRLPDQGRHDHVHEVRTVDDAMRLRAELADGGRRVVVIGAGFIGLEVAATAKALGNEVTVLEGADAPLVRGLGAEMGRAIGAMHETRGVAIRCGVTVDRLVDDGVVLGDGEEVAANVIVVGIGVVPATRWLEGSGLELRDGVVCDETLLARLADGSPVSDVYAAGDVLRWPNPLYDGEEMRVEHWTNAAEQGALAASNLISESSGQPTEAYAPVPFFWSEQYDRRIQFLGRAGLDDDVRVVDGSVDERRFTALFGRAGRLRGVLGVNMPRNVMPFRKHLLDRIGFDDAVAIATG